MQTYQLHSHNCELQIYSCGKIDSDSAILFLHGGPGSGANAIMELPVFQTFKAHHHCIHFDQRGSGASSYDLTKGLSMEDITNDVLLIVNDIKHRWPHQRLYLWGGSFGGCLACLCLESFSEAFAGVILSSPAILFSRQQGLDFFDRMKAPYEDRMPIKTPVSTVEALTPEAFFALPQTRDFIFHPQNPSNSLKHICAMSSWFFQHTFEHLFASLSLPILILQGKDDPICLYQNLEEHFNTFPHKTISLHVFETCGHAVFEDKQQSFKEAIEAFIGGDSLC